jgi:hypothetical protein
MISRALFSFVILLIAIGTSPAAGDTNQAALAAGQQRVFRQKIPWAVGFGMEGILTNVVVVEDHIQFQLTGWFWFHQYPEGGTNGQQIIKVDCQRGISATVNDPDSFVAMTSNWRGGSVRNGKGNLQKILQTAEKCGRVVKFELLRPKMDFGKEHGFTLISADVWRITDADLR